MPLSIDSSLAVRPDFDRGTRAAEPLHSPSASEAREFAGALARLERTPGPARAPAATLVRATRTRLSGDEAAAALREAWQSTLGKAPSDETLSILVGQWAHETGRGAAMLNYNFGGIKGSGPSGLSAVYQTREGWGENEVKVQDRFRAYGSAAEGAKDYVSLLARRYPEAVRAAEQGDPQAFVQALKTRGYFTGNETAYVKSVTSLSSRALADGYAALGTSPVNTRSPTAVEIEPLAELMLAENAVPPPEAPFPELRTQPARESLEVARFMSSSFADEVSRAELLMSALRIGQKSEPRG